MNRRSFLKAGLGLAGAGLLAACGKSATTPGAAAPAAAADVDKSKLAKKLSWYTWGGYTSDAVHKQFKDEFGVDVTVDTYGSNEEMEAKFKAGGNPGYDLITPSDYMVSKMVAANLLDKFDKGNVPLLAGVDAGHRGLYFDPADDYAVVYNWGCTGLAYDKSKVATPITSWKQVFEWPDALKGKLGMLDDVRELLGMALRAQGFSGNTADAAQIDTAKKALIDLKKRANYTLTDSPGAKTNLVAGDAIAAMIYTNDAVLGKAENKNLVFVIPGDVSTVWQDNLCIPKGAPSKYTAEVFMNFLLRPAVSAALSNELGLATAITEVVRKGMIDKALIGDKAVYPDIAGSAKAFEYLKKGDPRIDELYQRAFDEIKNA